MLEHRSSHVEAGTSQVQADGCESSAASCPQHSVYMFAPHCLLSLKTECVCISGHKVLWLCCRCRGGDRQASGERRHTVWLSWLIKPDCTCHHQAAISMQQVATQ